MAKSVLSIWDYVVFIVTILVSIVFGLYYVWRKQKMTTEEYLLGNRQIPWLAISLSMTTSFMSAIIVLGTPSEVYYYGTMYWWTGLTYAIMCFVTITVYIPVFYTLSLTSCYEYLELRFNKASRMMGTISFLVQTILYLGLVTYLPALALSQVTNLSLWGSLLGTGISCIIYSTLGGIKGIVGADCFQLGIMLIGLLTIIIKGAIDSNGFANIWKEAYENGNIISNDASFDPRVRHTIWSLLIGGTITWVSNYGIGQSQVQRYLACKSEKDAKLAVLFNCVFLNIILALVMLSGLICVSHFKDCDPLLTNEITKPDQMVPLMVIQKMGHMEGFTGLIISAAYCGTLSSVSTGIHSMSCVVIQDFIKPYFVHLSEYQLNIISRLFTLIFGVLSIILAFAASQISFILQAALSVWGVVGGPLVGVFTLGVFLPFVNSKGAIVGQICGFGITAWIAVGGQMFKKFNYYQNKLKTTTEGCIDNRTTSFMMTNLNSTTSPVLSTVAITESTEESGLEIYNLSYLYYGAVGAFVTIIIGIIISAITGFATTPNEYLCPFSKWIIEKINYSQVKNKKTSDEEKPLNTHISNL